MTEDQFRKAMRRQMDEYLQRIEVAYTFMIHNSSSLITAAHKDGIPSSQRLAVVLEENARTAKEMDRIFDRVSAQAAPQSLH